MCLHHSAPSILYNRFHSKDEVARQTIHRHQIIPSRANVEDCAAQKFLNRLNSQV